MTSKEALYKILDKYETYHNIECCEQYFDLIEQDLERLEVLISVLQKFIDEEEHFVLYDKYSALIIDGAIKITQQQCDVLKSVLKLKG